MTERRRPGDDPVEWFWRFVDKSGQCWIWTRGSSGGYGRYKRPDKPRQEQAHRVAYVYSSGEEIPKGLGVDHICRNTLCVRPEHLRLATQSQNGQNRSLSKNSTTGVIGVTRTPTGKFQAQAFINGKNVHLGNYDFLEDAAAASLKFRTDNFEYYVGENVPE